MTWIEKSLGERGQPRNPSREDTSRTHRHLEFQKGGGLPERVRAVARSRSDHHARPDDEGSRTLTPNH